jgi:hypothetical protein
MRQTTLLLLVTFAIYLSGCEHGYFLIEQAQDAAREEELDARFDRLEERLGIFVPNEDNASSASVAVAFPPASFPRETCGDPLPSDESEYPLTYYPIFIKNTADNLQTVKEQFCTDAFVKNDKATGEEVIMVASFYTQKASEFLLLMKQNFGEARLGTASVITEPF